MCHAYPFNIYFLRSCLPVLVASIASLCSAQPTPEESIRALRDVRKGYFQGPHGTPCRELQSLLRLRSKATQAVCDEIDRTTGESLEYKRALYRALGRIKDPSSIPWLAAKLTGADTELVRQNWLIEWTMRRPGVWNTSAHMTAKWTEGQDAWWEFFVAAFGDEGKKQLREPFLRVMSQCFHGNAAILVLQEAERDTHLSAAELLLVQAFLVEHGESRDVDRMHHAVKELEGSEEGRACVYEYAIRARDADLIPWLIRQVPERPREDQGDAVGILRRVTFRCDLKSRSEWERWYQRNSLLGRDRWLADELDDFEQLIQRDKDAARRALLGTCWTDSHIASRVRRWTDQKELHPAIARWIVASYHPFRRAELAPIAEAVVRESLADLDSYGRRGLAELDFIAGEAPSWDDIFLR